MNRARSARLASVGLVVTAGALVFSLPASAQSGAATVKATKITVTAGKPSELKFKLSKRSVAPSRVTFVVKNAGKIEHDFAIAGKKTRRLNPGQSARLTVTIGKGRKYQFICTVPGHAAGGMRGILKVSA